MTISAGRRTAEIATPKFDELVVALAIRCNDATAVLLSTPGLSLTKMASGPVDGSSKGLRSAGDMTAEGMSAPLPISRCSSPELPMEGMVAVPTIRSRVDAPRPASTSTVSPTFLPSCDRVCGPRTTSSLPWSACPDKIGGSTCAPAFTQHRYRLVVDLGAGEVRTGPRRHRVVLADEPVELSRGNVSRPDPPTSA